MARMALPWRSFACGHAAPLHWGLASRADSGAVGAVSCLPRNRLRWRPATARCVDDGASVGAAGHWCGAADVPLAAFLPATFPRMPSNSVDRNAQRFLEAPCMLVGSDGGMSCLDQQHGRCGVSNLGLHVHPV
jgi:hypothetical protein